MGVSRFARKIKEAVRHKNTEHASLALRHLTKNLDPAQPTRILDLGGACASNIKYYSTISRKFHFEDLSSAVAARAEKSSSSEASAVPSVLNEALSLRSNQVFDMIFCWDILNYLAPEEIMQLGKKLAEHSHPETKLFLLLPVGREITQLPIRFKVSEHDALTYEEHGSAKIKSPRYNKSDLKKLWPSFERKKSFLLKNGFEEHIYRFASGAKHAAVPPVT